MRWAAHFNSYPAVAKRLARAVRKQNLYRFQVNGSQLKMGISGVITDPMHRIIIADTVERGTAAMQKLYVTSSTLVNARTFFPKQLDFESCEAMKVTIPFTEYSQPAETMIIELPEEYIKNRAVRCPQAGQSRIGDLATISEQHGPRTIILTWVKELHLIICAVFFSSDLAITRAIYPDQESDPSEITIEEILLETSHKVYQKSLTTTDEETLLCESLFRASFNTCLFFKEFGVSEHVENASLLARCERHLAVAKKRKDPERIVDAEIALANVPRVCQYATPALLFSEEVVPIGTPGEPTGRTVATHWRGGHWQRYWMGSGTDKKAVWKRKLSILVNKHLQT